MSGDRELAGFAARGGCNHHTGSEFEEPQQTASIQWQTLDLILANDGTDGSILTREQRRRAFDGDGLLNAADHQFEVGARR